LLFPDCRSMANPFGSIIGAACDFSERTRDVGLYPCSCSLATILSTQRCPKILISCRQPRKTRTSSSHLRT
jgi:hypothetical protein